MRSGRQSRAQSVRDRPRRQCRTQQYECNNGTTYISCITSKPSGCELPPTQKIRHPFMAISSGSFVVKRRSALQPRPSDRPSRETGRRFVAFGGLGPTESIRGPRSAGSLTRDTSSRHDERRGEIQKYVLRNIHETDRSATIRVETIRTLAVGCRLDISVRANDARVSDIACRRRRTRVRMCYTRITKSFSTTRFFRVETKHARAVRVDVFAASAAETKRFFKRINAGLLGQPRTRVVPAGGFTKNVFDEPRSRRAASKSTGKNFPNCSGGSLPVFASY